MARAIRCASSPLMRPVFEIGFHLDAQYILDYDRVCKAEREA